MAAIALAELPAAFLSAVAEEELDCRITREDSKKLAMRGDIEEDVSWFASGLAEHYGAQLAEDAQEALVKRKDSKNLLIIEAGLAEAYAEVAADDALEVHISRADSMDLKSREEYSWGLPHALAASAEADALEAELVRADREEMLQRINEAADREDHPLCGLDRAFQLAAAEDQLEQHLARKDSAELLMRAEANEAAGNWFAQGLAAYETSLAEAYGNLVAEEALEAGLAQQDSRDLLARTTSSDTAEAAAHAAEEAALAVMEETLGDGKRRKTADHCVKRVRIESPEKELEPSKGADPWARQFSEASTAASLGPDEMEDFSAVEAM